MTTTKLTKSQKRAAFAKLPPAIVCKPLRFILERTAIKVTDPQRKQEHWVPGPAGIRARKLANRGDGGAVQAMAMRMAAVA
jgi:hypothetical protein